MVIDTEMISKEVITIVITMIGMPWTVWVTVSVFNQRQQLALLKALVSRIERLNDCPMVRTGRGHGEQYGSVQE